MSVYVELMMAMMMMTVSLGTWQRLLWWISNVVTSMDIWTQRCQIGSSLSKSTWISREWCLVHCFHLFVFHFRNSSLFSDMFYKQTILLVNQYQIHHLSLDICHCSELPNVLKGNSNRETLSGCFEQFWKFTD